MVMKIIYVLVLICLFEKYISEHFNECKWSTYRPGPYFGLRTNKPYSPLFGIMWYLQDSMYSVKKLRHFMEISDNINKYEWTAHNGCDYGELIIIDNIMKLKLEISFFTFNQKNWTVRLKGKTNDNENSIVIMWYISNPSDNRINDENFTLSYFNRTVSGNYEKSKNFFLKTIQDSKNTYPKYGGIYYNLEYFLILNIPEERLYDPSEYIIGELKDSVGNIPNHLNDDSESYRSSGLTKGNVFIQQIFLIDEFLLDIHLFENEIDLNELNIEKVTNELDIRRGQFKNKFFDLYNSKDKEFISIANSAISTLNSNILYMYGKIQILDNGLIKENNYTHLLAVGPDKTSHSRGFVWDEGFQQRVLSLWNLELSLQIVINWFENVNINTGWLAREISLDDESRSRAPPSSWVSIPNVSNPPSLFLFISNLFERNIDNELMRKFLLEILDKLEINAKWYIETQESSIKYVYSWKGKTDDFCLPSGLDDYPRSRLNGKNYIEGHLDLQSWIIALSKTMIKIYEFLQIKDERIDLWIKIYTNVKFNLISMFWNEDKEQFDDFYINESGNTIFSGHTGYLQLFPLLLETLDENDNKYIESILDLIINFKKGLRTKFGIRSLSINDLEYRKGQNYWTGPIWININYLVSRSLFKMKEINGYEYLKEIYNDINESVIGNMAKNFRENGFIWEVYDDITGVGKYNHPFTGWSALVLNMILEKY